MHPGSLMKHFDRYETDVTRLVICRISLYNYFRKEWSKHLNSCTSTGIYIFFTECHVSTTQMTIRITLCLIFAKWRSRFSSSSLQIHCFIYEFYCVQITNILLLHGAILAECIFFVFVFLIKLHRLKRRLRRNASNVDGMPSSSSSGRRYSVDSLERLVEDRLRNRPPPYTPDQDKPPSYEDSFQDPSSRHPSPTPVSAELSASAY